MKIVIDARESGTSTGRYIDKLVEYLQQIDRENQYTVILTKKRFEEVELKAPNFKKVATKYKEFSFGEQLGFAWQLYRLRADVVHFGMVQQPLLYVKRSVTTLHDLTTVRFRNPAKSRLWYWFKLPPYWLVIQLAVRRAKALITPSAFVLKDVRKYTKSKLTQGIVTHESADLIKQPPEPVMGLEGKQFLFYVGRPTPHKNLERLIRAVGELQKTHPNLHLVLAGKKDKLMEEHEKFADEIGVKHVMAVGYVSEGQLRWLYEHTACYVFPSMSEGFGLPGLEAMKHGAPVASSNATCLPEIYGTAAQYFSPFSVIEMTEAINEILTNKKLRTELIRRGRTQSAKYSWLKMAKQTLEIYRTAIAR